MNLDSQMSEISVSYHPKHPVSQRYSICDSRTAFEYLLKVWNPETIYLYEEFMALYLDRKNGVIGYRILGAGSNTGVVVDIKQLFAIALKVNACGIIVSHNHPSGRTSPSMEDNRITVRIAEGAKNLDLTLQDHLIITHDSYYSFRDEGRLGDVPVVFTGFFQKE